MNLNAAAVVVVVGIVVASLVFG